MQDERIINTITDEYMEFINIFNSESKIYNDFLISIRNELVFKTLKYNFQIEKFKQLYLKTQLLVLYRILKNFSNKEKIISSSYGEYKLDLESSKTLFYYLNYSYNGHTKKIELDELLNYKKNPKSIINEITLTIFKPIERKPSTEIISNLKDEINKLCYDANIIDTEMFSINTHGRLTSSTNPDKKFEKDKLNSQAAELQKRLHQLQMWSNINDENLTNWKTLYEELLKKLDLLMEESTANDWKRYNNDYNQLALNNLDGNGIKILIRQPRIN